MGVTNEEIFFLTSKDIVSNVIEGYNGTVCCYGQTSSGKTFTMTGSNMSLGIIPLSIKEFFKLIKENQKREYIVKASYIEIYNENLIDLLANENSRGLKIMEDKNKGIIVDGLIERNVESPKEMYDVFQQGEKHRHFGETNLNERSSRSHTIFKISVESRVARRNMDNVINNESNEYGAIKVSHLNLVDLAGSENSKKAQTDGIRLREGGSINKSLLALGNVISKLCDGVSTHIPYRDSKLTRLLQQALGNNSKTSIICNITPAIMHVEETFSTLYFASRAKRVVNKVKINEVYSDNSIILDSKIKMLKMKREIEEKDNSIEEMEKYFKGKVYKLQNKILGLQKRNNILLQENQSMKNNNMNMNMNNNNNGNGNGNRQPSPIVHFNHQLININQINKGNISMTNKENEKIIQKLKMEKEEMFMHNSELQNQIKQLHYKNQGLQSENDDMLQEIKKLNSIKEESVQENYNDKKTIVDYSLRIQELEQQISLYKTNLNNINTNTYQNNWGGNETQHLVDKNNNYWNFK